MKSIPEELGRRLPKRPRADYDEDEGGMFAVSYEPIKAGVFNIYLFGMIESAAQFIPAIEVLNAAGDNDVVRIHLSTPGGSLDATDTFIQSMQECDARVVVHATGGVHSAGSVILLHSPEFTLSENFNMLIHNGSFGAFGDFNKVVAHAKHSKEYMERVMRTTYEGFLTVNEIEQMIEGKDFWLDAEQFAKRYEGRNQYMAAKLGKVAQELLPAPVPKPKRKRPART